MFFVHILYTYVKNLTSRSRAVYISNRLHYPCILQDFEFLSVSIYRVWAVINGPFIFVFRVCVRVICVYISTRICVQVYVCLRMDAMLLRDLRELPTWLAVKYAQKN